MQTLYNATQVGPMANRHQTESADFIAIGPISVYRGEELESFQLFCIIWLFWITLFFIQRVATTEEHSFSPCESLWQFKVLILRSLY